MIPHRNGIVHWTISRVKLQRSPSPYLRISDSSASPLNPALPSYALVIGIAVLYTMFSLAVET